MDYIIDNVEFITELVKSAFIGIVGIFFIGLAIWIKTKEDRWNFKNICIGLLAGGMALLLISVSMVVDSLQDGGSEKCYPKHRTPRYVPLSYLQHIGEFLPALHLRVW